MVSLLEERLLIVARWMPEFQGRHSKNNFKDGSPKHAIRERAHAHRLAHRQNKTRRQRDSRICVHTHLEDADTDTDTVDCRMPDHSISNK